MSKDKNIICIFDGAIYNQEELCTILGTKAKISTVDLLLCLYEKFGFEKDIAKLNGMFAVVILDTKKQHLWIAGDRFGMTPIYYRKEKTRLIWQVK